MGNIKDWLLKTGLAVFNSLSVVLEILDQWNEEKMACGRL